MSALNAERQWRFARAGQPPRAYKCPCRAWHTGRYLGEEHVVTINEAPIGTRAENLAWDRVHCEWCWSPVVRARLVDTVADHLAFCRPGHARYFQRWMMSRYRPEVTSLCLSCAQEYPRIPIAGNEQQLYCSGRCKAKAKRRRRTMRRVEAAGRALIAQTGRLRQDPDVVMQAVSYLRACRLFPWPEVNMYAAEWIGDGQVVVMADKMPAMILVGVGPKHPLDLAARDAVWIVWDGYAGSEGLRETAMQAGLKPPARLELTGEWIEASLRQILDS